MDEECNAEMESILDPSHTHKCGGKHDAGDHLCKDPKCRRYFFSKKSLRE